MASGVTVHGLRELQVLFASAPKEAQKDLHDELRQVAEPIRSDASALAVSGIDRVGEKWSQMRVGVTRQLVYVAPKQRGVKGRGTGGRRRPKFATLLHDRAMAPALKRNEPFIARDVEELFDRLAAKWNRS